jgi:hypothetical protein
MQMPLAEKALRAYIKVIDNKAYLRAEKSIAPDKPLEEALENLRTSLDLDKDFLTSYSFFRVNPVYKLNICELKLANNFFNSLLGLP